MTLLLLAAACSDTGLHTRAKEVADGAPAIAVEPAALAFGDLGPGETLTLPFTVYSVGNATLRVDALAVDGDPGFSLGDEAAGFDLLPGESREVPVTFAPLAPGDAAAVVEVRSDDAERPVLPVTLTGGADVPSLVLTPEAHDFGELPTGCTEPLALTLQNIGTAPLLVEAWTYAGDGFSLDAATPPPFTLAPFARVEATVTFSPTAAGAATGALAVVSNDPRGVRTATQAGTGVVAARGEDAFTAPTDPPVDILLAVDQSASMDDDAAGLAAAFATFTDALGAVTRDWRLGVVTTDDGCFNGGTLTADTPDLPTTFADAVAYGDDRDIVYDEALFQELDAALDATDPGGCNEGFRRDGAALHLVVVSDEPERSTAFASAWTWDWYLARWRARVGTDALLAVSGVVDTDGCNEGADGYAEAIAATGGAALSICAGDWSGRLAALADASLAALYLLPLSATPVPATLRVEVDGVERATGWSWDAGANAVAFDALAPGSAVTVRYDVAAACPGR